jgi:Holliday junction resolvasome RuvABC DNA-binding subunit
LVAFLHDPKASEVETEGERVMSFATSRLTLADALKQVVVETLKKLGWEPPEADEAVNSSEADNLRVNMPLGDTGRFGPSGDLAKGAM